MVSQREGSVSPFDIRPTVSPAKNSLMYSISIRCIDHPAWGSPSEEAKRGPLSGPHPEERGSHAAAAAGHDAATRVQGATRTADAGVVDVP